MITLLVSAILIVVLAGMGLYFVGKRHPNHILFDLKKVKRVLLGKEVLLRDYDPAVELRVKQTPITRAKFKVIDFNNHLKDSPLTAEELVKVMDQVGVEREVNLDGGWSEALSNVMQAYNARYPNRFVTFTNTHFLWEKPWKVGSPDFDKNVQTLLTDAANSGALGLKVWKDLGLGIKDTEKKRVALDDPRLAPLWTTAKELGFILTFHVADPSASFKLIGPDNERYESLTQSTGEEKYVRAWLPPTYPPKAQIHKEFENLVKRYPDVIFIGTHMAMSAEDLEFLGGLLDRNPNLYTDISTQVDELGRQPYTARKFLIKYQDRILFATDGGKYWDSIEDAVEVYRTYFRFLETDDEYFDYPLRRQHMKGRWKVYGVNLPDEVLEKIYHKNAEKLLARQPVQVTSEIKRQGEIQKPGVRR
jgi:predicted TIM-barrel fold metal-dependent hydrolase